MGNPLLETWGRLWGQLTGQGYYHAPYEEYDFDSETLQFIHSVWFYHPERYLQAQSLIETGKLYPTFQYRHFKQRKNDGSFRELVEPEPTLKNVQKAILQNYLKNAPVHRAAMGYRPKLSIANHVWAHAGAKFIITADIQDFFPNTRIYRVRDWWEKQFSSQSAIELATLLTTYQGGLPQGAPTSPALSNVVNMEMDDWLSRKIERSGGIYTRYVDDMVFSWQGNNRPPSDIRQSIESGLHEFGYELKAAKWQQYRAEDEPEITGVILRKHGKVTIPDAMQQKIRQLAKEQPSSPQLAGYRGFQNMVEKPQRLSSINRNVLSSRENSQRRFNQENARRQDFEEDDLEDDYEDDEGNIAF